MDVCTYQELGMLMKDDDVDDFGLPGSSEEHPLDLRLQDLQLQDALSLLGESSEEEPEPLPPRQVEPALRSVSELEPEPEPEREPAQPQPSPPAVPAPVDQGMKPPPGVMPVAPGNTDPATTPSGRQRSTFEREIVPPQAASSLQSTSSSALKRQVTAKERVVRVYMPSQWKVPSEADPSPVEVIELVAQENATGRELVARALQKYNSEIAPSPDVMLSDEPGQFELRVGSPNAEQTEFPFQLKLSELGDEVRELVLRPLGKGKVASGSLYIQVDVEETERMGACTQTIAAPRSETFAWVLSQIGKKLQQPMPEDRYEFISFNYAGDEEAVAMGECVDSLRLGGGFSPQGRDPAAMPSIHSVTLRQIRMADEPDRPSSRRSVLRAPSATQVAAAATTSVARASMAARAGVMMSDVVANQYKEYQVWKLPGR